MKFELPPEVVMLAIDAHILQSSRGAGSLDARQREVERKQKHLAELVSAIILKEWNKKTLLLPR